MNPFFCVLPSASRLRHAQAIFDGGDFLRFPLPTLLFLALDAVERQEERGIHFERSVSVDKYRAPHDVDVRR